MLRPLPAPGRGMQSRPLLRHPGFPTCLLVEIWDGDSCSAKMGPRPFNPIPSSRQLCTATSQPAQGVRIGFRCSPWGQWGTTSCCPSPTGMGAVVEGPSKTPFLTHTCQLDQFGFTGGLGAGWDGAARAPAAPCPHGAQRPRFPPHPSSPQLQAAASVPQFPHHEIRDNDGGIKSAQRAVVFSLLIIVPGLIWDGWWGRGGTNREVLVVEQPPVHWIPAWGQYWMPQRTNPPDGSQSGDVCGCPHPQPVATPLCAQTRQLPGSQCGNQTRCPNIPGVCRSPAQGPFWVPRALFACTHRMTLCPTASTKPPAFLPRHGLPSSVTPRPFPFPAPSPRLQPEEGVGVWGGQDPH